MRSFLSLLFLFSIQSFATVDGHTRAYIVVKDVQSEEFFVEQCNESVFEDRCD